MKFPSLIISHFERKIVSITRIIFVSFGYTTKTIFFFLNPNIFLMYKLITDNKQEFYSIR